MPEPRLPRVRLNPAQWVRYHWRYTTADNWGRISKKRAPIEKPLWRQADAEAMASAAALLGEGILALSCRNVSTSQDWARCKLELYATWKDRGGRRSALDGWLERRRLQVLDELVKGTRAD